MTPDATLFIGHKDRALNLARIADEVFRILGITMWEERDSAHYPPDEHYYVGYTENVELTVYDADDNIKPEYPFRIAIEDATWRKGPGRLDKNSAAIATILANHSFRIFEPVGPWYRKDWDGKGVEYAV
jgi:hypothetical protein